MLRSLLVTLLLLFVLIPGVKGQNEFSDKDKSVIYTNAVKILEDYQRLINQIGIYVVSDIERAQSSSEGFLELFANRQVLIYNDLDPTHELSDFYEAETYARNIILRYRDGITINLDLNNARVSEIMSHENNIFSIDVLVKKTTNGNYLNIELNQTEEELTFRIAFSAQNRAFSNFMIVGIRSAASDIMIDYTQALREVDAEDINEEDLTKIQTSIKTILQDYSNFLGLIGDPQELEEEKESFKVSFLNLFPDKETRVYNDIEPEPEASFISVDDYLTSYVANYPDGINNLSVNVDSARFGKVMKDEEGGYYTYVDADKFFSGNYMGREAFSDMFPLIFRITFTAAGKTYSDFQISSVDITTVDFYEATPETGPAELPQIVIKPVTRKGFALSLIGSFGLTNIDDENIESLSIPKDSVSWNTSPLSGYITALGISYFFNDNIAVRSGIEFNTYSGKFNLNGKFGNTILTADVNDDLYYKRIAAEYDSLVKINYLTIPVLANYTSGRPGKLGFFAESGVKISIPLKATYKCTGDYIVTGYYPDNPSGIQILDIEELGFYSRESINETNTMTVKDFNLAFYASAGINIPLGYYSSITIGPEVTLGLTDICNANANYFDIFGNTHYYKPTKIKNFGLRVSLAYKL